MLGAHLDGLTPEEREVSDAWAPAKPARVGHE